MKKNLPNARNRIMEAAVKVFAEKSFEGARIDEIAKEAQVPKSLIYYHFKSKDEILEVLIQDFLKKYLELITIAEKDTHQSKELKMKDDVENVYASFEEENADLIRIILIDSLKKSKEKPLVFRIVEKMIETEMTFNMGKQCPNYDPQERRIAEFFTDIIPKYAFICFKEAWSSYFNIDKKELETLFNHIMIESHGAYHKYHK